MLPEACKCWTSWVWIPLLSTDDCASGPQVCSDLPENCEQTGAATAASPYRTTILSPSLQARRVIKPCNFNQHKNISPCHFLKDFNLLQCKVVKFWFSYGWKNRHSTYLTGTKIATIAATVREESQGIVLVYRLIGSNPAFTMIDSTSGDIFTQTIIDREIESYFIYTVEAVDNRSPPKTGYVTVSE